MKKIVVFITVVIMVLAIALIFLQKTSDRLVFDPAAAEETLLSKNNLAERLELCQGSSAPLAVGETYENRGSKYQNCASDISDENLTILRSIQEVRANHLCSYNYREGKSCDVAIAIDKNSQSLWKYEWNEVTVRSNFYTIELVTIDDNYILIYSASVPKNTPSVGEYYLLEKAPEYFSSK